MVLEKLFYPNSTTFSSMHEYFRSLKAAYQVLSFKERTFDYIQLYSIFFDEFGGDMQTLYQNLSFFNLLIDSFGWSTQYILQLGMLGW